MAALLSPRRIRKARAGESEPQTAPGSSLRSNQRQFGQLPPREYENGILGGSQLIDHIHPKFRGHRTIADALAGEMVRQGWLKPAGDWEARRQPAYQAHFDALDDIYFARGLRELNALRAWSSGRADGPPIETRLKHLGPLKNRTSQGRTDQE